MTTLTEAIGGFSQSQKINSFTRMGRLISELRDEGSRVILAQGVFDIPHMGHVGYFRAALTRGDILVVGVENDASVKRNKGASRPWNLVEDRVGMISEYVSVGLVFSYTDAPRYDRPDDFVDRYAELQPTGIAVATWDPHLELKYQQAAQAGTQICPIKYKHDNSTTAMMQHLGYRE